MFGRAASGHNSPVAKRSDESRPSGSPRWRNVPEADLANVQW